MSNREVISKTHEVASVGIKYSDNLIKESIKLKRTIDQQNELIEKLIDGLSFYGDRNNWEPDKEFRAEYSVFTTSDFERFRDDICEDLEIELCCGKKAREILNSEVVKQWRER